MTWQVIAERPRDQSGWPKEMETLFQVYRDKVEAGTHVMATRMVKVTDPDTGCVSHTVEQRVVKRCRKPLQPNDFWSAPTGMDIYAGQR